MNAAILTKKLGTVYSGKNGQAISIIVILKNSAV